MNDLQMNRLVATLPASASTNATTLVVDTQYWDSASFAVLRASNASTVFASTLKVEDSDSSGSGYADVTGLVGGTSFTIPAVADTSGTSTVKIDVDCKARKRYLRLTVTPSVSVPVAAVCRLGRGDSAPTTASEAGVIGWVRG
jgi:hypothetical protein